MQEEITQGTIFLSMDTKKSLCMVEMTSDNNLWHDGRNYQQWPPWGNIGGNPGRSVHNRAEEKALHSGATGGHKTGVCGTERARQARLAEEASRVRQLMSRSKKWRLELALFLGENGSRQYNGLCKGCFHPCKQSLRAVVVSCSDYLSFRSKKCGN